MRISDWSSDVCSSDLMRSHSAAAPWKISALRDSSTIRLPCATAPAEPALAAAGAAAAVGDTDADEAALSAICAVSALRTPLRVLAISSAREIGRANV